MRGKRSKQYRKLMERYSMTFGFREPYQVLVDATMIQDSCKFKMDLAPALERTVHGKVKPMVTQCEIRKLYSRKSEPGIGEAIDLAKKFERRRCGHHPDEYPEPLSTRECLHSVVDPKQTGENKHRYVVACQDDDVRRTLRAVRGVPQIYIKRSVMILEPMADESAQVRAKEERSKFRAEIKKQLGKRKREGGEEDDTNRDSAEGGHYDDRDDVTAKAGEVAKTSGKKKRRGGPKEPNPLSVKKSKKSVKPDQQTVQVKKNKTTEVAPTPEGSGKRKRRKKNKTDGNAPDSNGPSIAVPASPNVES